MSRYLILVLLNTPLVVASIVSAVVSYKLGRSTLRRFVFRVVFWLAIFTGLVFTERVYSFLFSNNLTRTEPLSLFDVVQITGILFTLFLANRAYLKADLLERQVHDLHQELSIRLSRDKSK